MLSLGEEPSETDMLQKPDITMDDLLAKASNLTVLDEDGWEINEARGDVAGGHCAKGRFCSNKPMSRPLLKTILGRGMILGFVQALPRCLKMDWAIGKKTYGPWLKADDKREAQTVSKAATNELLQQHVQRPVMYEDSSSNMQNTMLGAEVPGAIINPPGNLEAVNSGLFIVDSNGNSFANLSRQQDNKVPMMEKGESSQVNCKRNGSWRNDHESLKGLAAMDMESVFDSEGLRKNRTGNEVDYNKLVEIPISYDVGIERLNKEDGPLKRRKVTPRRPKIKGKGVQTENFIVQMAMNEGSTLSRGISKDLDLNLDDNLKAENLDYHPGMIFLSETRLNSSGMEFVRVQLGYTRCFTVDARGKSGGLALLWTSDFVVQIKSFTVSHIDALVENDLGFMWRFTGFYGSPDPGGRVESWKLLFRLKNMFNYAWICGGDFNEIASSKEKKGGGPKPDYLMKNFRQAMSDYHLKEIDPKGTAFTWCNGRTSNLIFEKLDHVLCNSDWMNHFKTNKTTLLKWWNSDHRPILLEAFQGAKGSLFRRKWGTRFHYEHAWADNEECHKIINEVWRVKANGKPIDTLTHLISNCGKRLHEWNITQKNATFSSSKELKGKIDWLSKSSSMSDWIARQKLEKDLNGVEEKREMYWRQRSRALWLKHGDRNTKFFHFKASARRKKSTIEGLFNDNGKWCTAENEITEVAINYFQKLFSSSTGGIDVKEGLRGKIPCRISEADNRALREPFTSEEIQASLFQVHPLKAPGNDGLPGMFFHNNWDLIKDDFTAACLDILNQNADCKAINETLICLILKIKQPAKMSDFRPISLCNVVYKVVSKCLANRMKLSMNSAISDNQSAFIGGRIIQDNAMRLRKSPLYEESKIKTAVAATLANYLGVSLVENHTKYLGMPSFVGRNKKQVFGIIRDKVEAKLRGWKMGLFSQAGKEVLIKAVIQAIPCYIMSCFRISKGILKEMESMIARFQWGSTTNKHKLHWGNWKKLCRLKEQGGMGFRDLEDFNKAMLAKQGWKLITEPESLMARVLKALYFPQGNFMNANIGHYGSTVWRSILWGREILLQGSRWCVGNGCTIRINEDAWLPRGRPFSLRTKVLLPEGTTLDKLINTAGKWKINEVYSWFHKDDIPWVLGIIPLTSSPDWMSWSLNNNGKYSVASGYKTRFIHTNLAECSNAAPLKAWWKFIWSSKLIPKMKNFIWRVFNQWLPTKIELSKRGMSLETNCDWCQEKEEDICHALWFCPKVLKIWKLAGFDTQNFIHMPKASDVLFYLWGKLPKEDLIQFIGLSWLIWQCRNIFIFKHQVQEIHSWVRWALEKLDDFFGECKDPRQDNAVTAKPKWGPPPSDCVMINTDASLIDDKMGYGLSAVLRDSVGDLIVVETVFVPGIASIFLAEAVAVKLGVRLAQKWSVSKAIVAADCLSIINSLQSSSALNSDWGMLCRDILSLKHHFLSLNFTHVHRDCNAVANALAIWSRMTHSSCI
uniref:Reverse transcriptase n=1 Tax=Cannabis sativa TaxID=3483 RepID=A0A803Q7N5_CANSA